jgi:NAD(P)-dependent dehydrogenase (short-subunit alcohol dehydrogenase family)
MDFEHKIAVVTGAASGIGRATAEALAESGAMVICADIDRDKGEAAAAAIRNKGQKAEFLPVDLTDDRFNAPLAMFAGRRGGHHYRRRRLGPMILSPPAPGKSLRSVPIRTGETASLLPR